MTQQVDRAKAPNADGGMSKMEAVRKALAELGSDAMPMRIQEFVKERFNLEMTVNHISNCKSEIARQATKGKTATPKAGGGTAKAASGATKAQANGGSPTTPSSQATENGTAAAPTTPSAPQSISKIEAVRQALKAKGKNATATQLQPWIKSKFNLEISNEHITKYKGKILSKRATKKPTPPKATASAATPPKPSSTPTAPAKPTTQTPAAAAQRPGVATEGVRLEDVRMTRELVNRVGVGPLLELIALFE